jgi:hypothetical protein
MVGFSLIAIWTGWNERRPEGKQCQMDSSSTPTMVVWYGMVWYGR